jgi:PEP-CTERM motif
MLSKLSLSRIFVVLLASTLSPMLFVSASQAVTLGFGCISNNDATQCGIGVSQLSVEVVDIGGDQVRFDFMNIGSIESSITDVYFDDGTLLGIATLVDADEGIGGDPGVDFSVGGAPPDLPAGNSITPAFETTAGFLADSDSPSVPTTGVNPGETLGVIFDLVFPGSFADILAELANGDLRVGIHLQSIDGGGSESFVNLPIPEPGTALLMGMGLTSLATRRRR